jgi:hypothetical protein
VVARRVTFVFAAAWMLNPLCGWLAPVALAWVFFYSYTKRFTPGRITCSARARHCAGRRVPRHCGRLAEPWYALPVLVGGRDVLGRRLRHDLRRAGRGVRPASTGCTRCRPLGAAGARCAWRGCSTERRSCCSRHLLLPAVPRRPALPRRRAGHGRPAGLRAPVIGAGDPRRSTCAHRPRVLPRERGRLDCRSSCSRCSTACSSARERPRIVIRALPVTCRHHRRVGRAVRGAPAAGAERRARARPADRLAHRLAAAAGGARHCDETALRERTGDWSQTSCCTAMTIAARRRRPAPRRRAAWSSARARWARSPASRRARRARSSNAPRTSC